MDYPNTSGIKSPFSPRIRQSISGRRPLSISSAKKNQSKYMQGHAGNTGEVIYKTPFSSIETYGMPLPVMVTEALTFGSGEVSVRLSSCGWCWLVVGRRVLCWPRDPAPPPAGSPAPPPHAAPPPPPPPAARELTLPQTDLAHKADLVALFYEDGAQMPSCIGVSPEGTVRYWASVCQEGAYVDVGVELAGQECDRLTEPSADGYLLLATTTCTVLVLSRVVLDGRATVSCRTLRPASGWLGGLGRRVSVLFFGSMPAHADTKLVNVVSVSPGPVLEPERGEPAGCVALATSGSLLQLWRGDLHEHDLRQHVHLPQPQGEVGCELVTVDAVAAPRGEGLLLLVSAGGAHRSPDLRYAIVHMSVLEATGPRVVSLVWWRGARPEPDDAPLRLLPAPAQHRHAVYTAKYIAHVSSAGAGAGGDKPDVVDVSAEGDRILGAASCHGVPLIFTSKHGVAVLNTAAAAAAGDAQSMCSSPLGSPSPSPSDMYEGNLSLYEIDPHEVSVTTTDACGKLKTAFLFHLRRDVTAATALLRDLFPPPPPRDQGEGEEERDVDAVLDRTVLRITTELLDDMPAGDPRWKQRATSLQTSIPLGSSCALQVASQLRDKQRALALLVEFLRATSLWHRLSLVTREGGGGGAWSTRGAVCALAERVAAALVLRALQQGPHRQLIDTALYQVACGDAGADVEEEPEVEAALSSGALAPSDVCYRRVSRIDRVVRAIARAQPPPSDARAAAHHVAATLHVINAVLTEVHKCRAAWAAARGGAAGCPWTAEPGPRGLLHDLHDLQARSVTQYAAACPDGTLQAQVYEESARLADLLLTDADHLRHNSYTLPLYERLRRDAIQPFLSTGQRERAAALADKYRDFDLLISMCVQHEDIDKLYTYIDKYEDQGLAEATFAWLVERGAERGGGGARLLRWLGARYPRRLEAWLAAVPERAPLLALHHLSAGQHAAAAGALAHLAATHTLSLNRMTTMASLAKLCLVASGGADSPAEEEERRALWRQVETRLALSEQHAALPRDIRLHHGMDQEDTRVHDAEELLQMYISSESRSLTEFDYKKALDLTEQVADTERRDELRLRVWCACILRDEWPGGGGGEAGEGRDKMFFRLIDLVHVMGGDVELLLPPLDDILTAPQLAELVSDPGALYALRYGYECLDARSPPPRAPRPASPLAAV